MSGLAFRSWGLPSHPAVCFLHGFMGRAADWDPIVRDLENVHAIGIDLPGHGASLGLPDTAYSLEGALPAIERALDRVGVDQCALVGYSMGGRIASLLALSNPARFPRLIAESAHPGIADAAGRADRRRLDGERAARLAADFPGFVDDWYRQPLFQSQERWHAAAVENRLRGRPQELARALAGFSTGNQPDLGERLRRTAVSTLLIAGALDDRYAALVRDIAAGGDGPSVRIIPNAGHNVHFERPQAFKKTLLSFLSRTDR